MVIFRWHNSGGLLTLLLIATPFFSSIWDHSCSSCSSWRLLDLFLCCTSRSQFAPRLLDLPLPRVPGGHPRPRRLADLSTSARSREHGMGPCLWFFTTPRHPHRGYHIPSIERPRAVLLWRGLEADQGQAQGHAAHAGWPHCCRWPYPWCHWGPHRGESVTWLRSVAILILLIVPFYLIDRQVNIIFESIHCTSLLWGPRNWSSISYSDLLISHGIFKSEKQIYKHNNFTIYRSQSKYILMITQFSSEVRAYCAWPATDSVEADAFPPLPSSFFPLSFCFSSSSSPEP